MITLYHMPGACSRVTMNALEEAGAVYQDHALNLLAGAQKSAAYLAVNPKGKVPALVIDEQLFTENAAILHYLHGMFPEAHLLPEGLAPNQGLSDLVWCGGTLHPMTRQVRMPIRFTDGEPDGVKSSGLKAWGSALPQIEARLAGGRWWYGEVWSIVDVYIYWCLSTAESGGLDLSGFPGVVDHAARVRARPSFVRALMREQAALERDRIQLPPGATL